MSDSANVFIPMDRRQAMASGTMLPDRTIGAALFADISGFTPLTEGLAKELGRRRGAEELTKTLNLIYGGLIAEVMRYHGSVIGFSGDAITCWLDGDNGLRAAACALSMQQVMQQFETIRTPSGLEFPLAIKVAIAAGSARRFRVGDPEIKYWDVLAGATLDRLAAAEHEAESGEVVVSAEVVENLAEMVFVSEWRDGETPEAKFAVVSGLKHDVATDPWLDLAPGTLPEEMVRQWVLPATYERVKSGLDRFQAELRPAVALFLRFGGINYDQDDAAGEKLDAYVRWVQRTAAVYDGALLQLTIGDKGSYIYIAFGAPVAHEDDVARAALAAIKLRSTPSELAFIGAVQIGISKGRMRVGPYGSPERSTYGVLGDHTNLAARLMQNAPPGDVLVSLAAQKDAVAAFEWESCSPIQAKGKSEPVIVFRLMAPKARQESHLQESRYALPMVGRQEELAQVEQQLDQVFAGRGQILGITAEAGLGKSRLVAEIVRQASEQQLDILTGECQSYGTNISYHVWENIWQGFFGLDPDWTLEKQIRSLEASLEAISPRLARRLPLLGVVLNLTIPDNDLTQSMDAELRKASLEALLVDCVRARVETNPLVFVVDDAHWLDPLSNDLLEAVGRAITNLPVLILLAYRPPELDHLQGPSVVSLPHCTVMPLTDFTADEAERLITLKLAQVSGEDAKLPAAFIERITERAQGNPFYIEELINYLHDRDIDPTHISSLEQIDLPNSLHSLILSRIDQLNESQKITLKVASIIGRLFQRSWLWGVDPEIGDQEQVDDDLKELSRIDLTPLDQVAADEIYIFKHIVTREVAYESLPFSTRALLHGQLGVFIEQSYAHELEQYIELLAYHYDFSNIEDKKREYLRKAGDAARAAYANEPAIEYYRRLLPLLAEDDRMDILLRLGEVLELVGEWSEAGELYEQALALAESRSEQATLAESQHVLGGLRRKEGDYSGAENWFKQAQRNFEELGNLAGAGRVLAEIGEVYRLKGDYDAAESSFQKSLFLTDTVEEKRARLAARAGVLKSAGTLANQQGDPQRAREQYEESLAILRELNDKPGIGGVLNNLGVVAMFQEDYPTAQPLYEESLAVMQEIGYRWAVGYLLNNLALVIRYQGDSETARQMLEESVAVRRALGDKWGIANSLSSLTNLLVHQGEYGGVQEMLDESLRINQELGDKTAIAYCLEDYAGLAAGTGHPRRALRLAGAAAALREDIGGPLPAGEQAALDRTLDPAWQAPLSHEARRTAWESGEAMSMEQAIDEALLDS
jgi:class 3 adenylate cyclase/tetratricopeptide (TPR) repeat protein